MKKIILFSLVSALGVAALYFFNVSTQSSDTLCCDANATQAFNEFASQEAFVAKHIAPTAFTFKSNAGGEMVSFTTPDGKTASAFFLKTAKKSKKYLFVFQEWWGLNDHIKQEAEKYFNDLGDVNVLAIDMYDGKVATKPEDAGKYMQAAEPARLEAIVKGAMTFAGKKAKIATVGWCFGGGLSLNASLLAGKQAKACVIYYGMPTKEIEKLQTLNTEVLGIFGKEDTWINPEVVAAFEKNMATANKQLTVKMYDADHAFANPSNPKYKKDDAQDAYTASLAFIRNGLAKK